MNTKEEYKITEALREAVAINSGKSVGYEDVFKRYRGDLKLTSVERMLRMMSHNNGQVVRLDGGLYTHRKLKGLNNLRGFGL